MKRLFLLLMIITSMGLCAQTQDEKIPFHPADQSLFVMPTAFTMPQGMHAITDVEVAIIQYSYAITNRTHLSAGTIFPINTEALESFSLGFKQNFVKLNSIESAFWGSYTIVHQVLSVGSVISLSKNNYSLHLGTGYIHSRKDDVDNLITMIGGKADVSKRVSLIAELDSYFELDSSESETALFMGVRLKGKNISWDLGGIRPVKDLSDSDLILIPFLKATFMF